MDRIGLSRQISRILMILVISTFLTHIFACLFFVSARLRNFDSNTWVYQRGIGDMSTFDQWCQAMYWAFQTVTTVGYGDFGAYNGIEILITCVWMFAGVAIYSFVVGSMTSSFTGEDEQRESLDSKLEALMDFKEAEGLDDELYK